MKHSEVELLIYSMLTENTGSSMLDSGGAYGRNHQRNAKLTIEDFQARPEAVLEVSIRTWDGKQNIEAIPTVDLFHKLTKELDLDGLCSEFNSMECEDWDGDFYGVSESGSKFLLQHLEPQGDAWNTYNWDNNFSQIIQGHNFEHKDTGDQYCIIQIHGGCDARGGYTDAKLFKISSGDQYAPILDNCSFSFELDGETYAVDWSGEFINYDGQCAEDKDFEALVRYLGVSEGEDKTLEGSINECY